MSAPAEHLGEGSGRKKRRNSNARDLFPESLPNRSAPLQPTAGTIKHAALVSLVAGPVSQPTFSQSWRLAAYIGELLDDGWMVLSREIAYHSRIIAEYRLDLTDEPTRAAVAAFGRKRGV